MRFIRTLVICSALVLPAFGVARAEGTDNSLEAVLIQSASTPEQHAALAAHYRAQAEQARRAAANHKSMSRSYAGMKAPLKEAGQSHCAKLTETYEQQAAQFDDLAAAEEAAAKAK
jgi:hypothetical protein